MSEHERLRSLAEPYYEDEKNFTMGLVRKKESRRTSSKWENGDVECLSTAASKVEGQSPFKLRGQPAVTSLPYWT